MNIYSFAVPDMRRKAAGAKNWEFWPDHKIQP